MAPAERALLLLVKRPAPGPGRAPEPPHRYLCGHDERAWFVAASPRRRVSHPDHATLSLPGWHRVLANTEAEAPFALNLAFLD